MLTREGNTIVPSANQGAKARSAGLRSVASRAERGEEGLRLPRLLFAGTRMEKYCADTTVSFMIALIVEAPGHVLTRGRNAFALIVEEKEYVLTRDCATIVPSANQGAKARSAGL